MDIAKRTLERGQKYPCDAPDDWWGGDASNPATDWAHTAARGVLADLNDRGGIKHGFDNIDEEIRAEIVNSLAAIIRLAAPPLMAHPKGSYDLRSSRPRSRR